MSAWPPFVVTFVAGNDIDAVRALRRVLKFAGRECGLRAVDAHPVFDALDPDLPRQIIAYCGNRNALENVREAARRCLRSKLSLSAHERSFLSDMAQLAAAPTPRQRAWLRSLYARAKRTNAKPNSEGVRP